MKNRKLSTILLSLLSLIAALYGLFHFTNPRPDQKVRDKPDYAISKEATANLDKMYRAQLDSIAAKASSLQAKEYAVKAQLKKAKESNRSLQQQVNGLVARSRAATDTPAKLVVCDSLQEAVGEWVTESAYKDSLYDSEVTVLNEIISNKDGTLYVRQQMYATIRQSFDNCFANSELLLEENKLYARQSKRWHIKNKILSAGVMLVSGIAVYSFIKH